MQNNAQLLRVLEGKVINANRSSGKEKVNEEDVVKKGR